MATIFCAGKPTLPQFILCRDTNITPETSFHELAMGLKNPTFMVAYLVI